MQSKRSSSIGGAAEAEALRKRIVQSEAIGVTAQNGIDLQPAEATATEPSRIERPAGALDAAEESNYRRSNPRDPSVHSLRSPQW
jgi:hypothetical protein